MRIQLYLILFVFAVVFVSSTKVFAQSDLVLPDRQQAEEEEILGEVERGLTISERTQVPPQKQLPMQAKVKVRVLNSNNSQERVDTRQVPDQNFDRALMDRNSNLIRPSTAEPKVPKGGMYYE